MAVPPDEKLPISESIFLKKSRKRYRIPVRSHHWQLRSLISVENNRFVYFPGGPDDNYLQRLDTETGECETIRYLTFIPRCLVSQNGWLCCGSEYGDFSVVRVDGNGDPMGIDSAADTESDSRSPAPPDSTIMTRHRRIIDSKIMKGTRIAKERVNCVTLWFPPKHKSAGEVPYKEPVAVLANNDETVAIVSLKDCSSQTSSEPLDIIRYPDFVNRAVISPDGRFLIAIVDDPFLYISRRCDEQDADDTDDDYLSGFGNSCKKPRTWKGHGRLMLQSQRRDDRTEIRGSFAACFSESGEYLAVGTQYGTVSVFNTAMLEDLRSNPLITFFQSSRPNTPHGAIRDMAFCPGPNDLLAWTEDKARVGIADIRSGFVVRQTLDITDQDSFEHIRVINRGCPRSAEEVQAVSRASGSSDLNDGFNVIRTSNALGHGMGPIREPTSSETLVYETSADERRRRGEARQQQQNRDSGVTHPLESERRPRRTLTPSDDATATATAQTVPFSGTLGATFDRMTQLRQRMRADLQPHHEVPVEEQLLQFQTLAQEQRDRRRLFMAARRHANGTTSPQPRLWPQNEAAEPSRGQSLDREANMPDFGRILQLVEMDDEAVRREREREWQRQQERLWERERDGEIQRTIQRDRARMMEREREREQEWEWDRIRERERERERVRNSGREGERHNELPRDPDGVRMRERNGDLIRERDRNWQGVDEIINGDSREATGARFRNWAALLPLLDGRRDLDPTPFAYQEVTLPTDDNTSGLAWSQDGQVLYVGAENGIYEFQVNSHGRKFFPSLSFR